MKCATRHQTRDKDNNRTKRQAHSSAISVRAAVLHPADCSKRGIFEMLTCVYIEPTARIPAFFSISRTLGSNREGTNHEKCWERRGGGKGGQYSWGAGRGGGSVKRAAGRKKSRIGARGPHAHPFS